MSISLSLLLPIKEITSVCGSFSQLGKIEIINQFLVTVQGQKRPWTRSQTVSHVVKRQQILKQRNHVTETWSDKGLFIGEDNLKY